jgi:hypothetical protein
MTSLVKKSEYDTNIPAQEKPKKASTNHTADAMRYMMDEMQMQRRMHIDPGNFDQSAYMAKPRQRRGTGKSFRMILAALKTASEGDHAVFVCQNQHERDRMFHKSMDMVNTYISDGGVRFEREGSVREVYFRNGGAVRFITLEEHMHRRYQGHLGDRLKVFDDCWDHR